FGVISSRRRSSSCMRRQRLRSAIATARLAWFWPTMYLSSSLTISRGVMTEVRGGDGRFDIKRFHNSAAAIEFFDSAVVIGVDADIAGDGEAAFDNIARRQFGAVEQGARSGLCKGSAGADGDQIVFRFDDIAVAGDDQRRGFIGDSEQGFQPAQRALG